MQSRLAEEATQFLDRLADVIDSTPWEFAGKALRASSAFVEPVVFTGGSVEPWPQACTDSGGVLPLLVCGHRHWPEPLAELPGGMQVLNVYERVVVLEPEQPVPGHSAKVL